MKQELTSDELETVIGMYGQQQPSRSNADLMEAYNSIAASTQELWRQEQADRERARNSVRVMDGLTPPGMVQPKIPTY